MYYQTHYLGNNKNLLAEDKMSGVYKMEHEPEWIFMGNMIDN